MRRTLVVTAVAGGTLAALLAGGVAVAGTDSTAAAAGSQSCTGAGNPAGEARGRAMGPDRARTPGMMQAPAAVPASGTLTEEQKADLLFMIEEEKLAHDVYVVLGQATGDVRFDRIAAAETRHADAVRTMLDRYGLADPTVGAAVGEFTNAELQARYDSLVAQGRQSLDAALEVGRTIEATDIADLAEASQGLSAPDVLRLYANLTTGSQHHLQAFGG
jgi:hypothetical protein